MRFRFLLLLLVLLADAAAQEVKLEVKPLAPDVWLHTSWQTTATWGLVPSNGLIVREADHIVVIDTAWGAAPSRALLAWIDRELKLPVTRLIVTHFHDDRLGGWEVFAERGVRIVTSEQTLALAKVEPTPAFDLYQLAPGEKLARGTLEILYPGPAHAPDNVVVWLPAHQILAGGCAVRSAVSGGLGNLSDASVADWAASIARVQAAYPAARLVLPGHGDPGGPELLEHTKALATAALHPKSN
ncbi:Beta-lactamase 2 precursor [Lacunisphaera limnophila]|uniref:beta-lactamase n=1 Tax=Lacunisphaera limnophila TaxID=1838286 RepID=A0A1I7PHU6_9BACT|nr:subclass B1 metallo-beta-lactamase [Lacunisphaera limnophila]AOS43191.1 Beta-lactamase 2 precursor [Lacunisphaera limnophila]